MKATRSLLVVLVFTLIGCAGLPPKTPEHSQQGDYTYLKAYLTWLIEDKNPIKALKG